MQHRIQRTGADFVTVARKFFSHGQSKHGFFDGMMKNVQPDQPEYKYWSFHNDIVNRLR